MEVTELKQIHCRVCGYLKLLEKNAEVPENCPACGGSENQKRQEELYSYTAKKAWEKQK